MINILIVDDHSIVRRGLMEIIRETLDLDVRFDEAASGQEAILKTQQNPYDIVLLDISMPGRNGLDALKAIKSGKPDLPVLIISMYPEEQFAIRSFRSGASGYLTKESAPDELKGAILKLLRGGKYISTSTSEMLLEEMRRSENNGNSKEQILSNREYQVSCMIASGMSLKDISHELNLSEKTISTYRTRILEKLNIKSNAQLVSYAIKEGMINHL